MEKILVLTPKLVATDHCEKGIILVRGKLEYHNTYMTRQYLSSFGAHGFNIVLVDSQEKIETGDIYYTLSGNEFTSIISRAKEELLPIINSSDWCYKVKATTIIDVDEVPLISNISVKQLVDYYNGNGEMPSRVKVKFNDDFPVSLEIMRDTTLTESLKEYLKNTSREQVLKDWEECSKYDEVGPTVDEFIENQKNHNEIWGNE